MRWFYEYRHRMCADPRTAWARIANVFIVPCACCSFWRGALLGGLVGAIVGAALVGIIG
jgi:hypothetical protein